MEKIFSNITSLLIIMVIGWAFGKRKFFEESAVNGMNKFIFNISLPSLIVSSMFRKFQPELLTNAISIIVFGLLYYPFLFFIYRSIGKKVYGEDYKKSSIFVILMTFANVGYIGYPVINAVLGETGIFYTAVYNLTHGIYLWSLGIMLVGRSKGQRLNILKWLKGNPPILALLISFTLFLSGIEIPQAFKIPFETLGKTATPLVLFVVGYSLSKVRLKELFDLESVSMTILKLIAVPTLLAILLRYVGLEVEVKKALLIISAMPCGVNSVIIAKNYGVDDKLATKALFVSTIALFLSIYYIVFILLKII